MGEGQGEGREMGDTPIPLWKPRFYIYITHKSSGDPWSLSQNVFSR